MYKIINNSTQKLISNLAFLNNLFESNHLKKNQALTVSLGIKDDKESSNYTVDLTFPKFVGYGTDEMRELKIQFDLVKTTGFTTDNAQVAKDAYLRYLNDNYDIFVEFVDYIWSDYNIGLILDTKFPTELKKYLESDQYQALIDAENQNNELAY